MARLAWVTDAAVRLGSDRGDQARQAVARSEDGLGASGGDRRAELPMPRGSEDEHACIGVALQDLRCDVAHFKRG